MAIMETTQALPETGLHVYGALLFIARLGHAWGLTRGIGLSLGRTGGIILTTSLFLVAAAACIVRYFT